jgi:hypothetical protein
MSRQKVTIIPNNAQLVQIINDYLQLGYVLHQIINLAPVSNNIFIVYYDPATED